MKSFAEIAVCLLAVYRRITLLLVACFSLAGCSQGMSGMIYSPASENIWKLGYSETQLAPDVYRVTYNGYSIPASKATDFALLRSAELCLAAGYTHFIVTEQSGQSASSSGIVIPSGNIAVYASVTNPEITLAIQLVSERPNVYAAAFIQQSLKKKYGLK
jgi:hypothetical protein